MSVHFGVVIGTTVSHLSWVFWVPDTTHIALLLCPGHFCESCSVLTPSLGGTDFAFTTTFGFLLCTHFLGNGDGSSSHLSMVWVFVSSQGYPEFGGTLIEVWEYPVTPDSSQGLRRCA